MSDVALPGSIEPALRKGPNLDGGFHPLTGDRAGRFAMTVTRNYRLTFAKIDEHTVADLDLEDYH